MDGKGRRKSRPEGGTAEKERGETRGRNIQPRAEEERKESERAEGSGSESESMQAGQEGGAEPSREGRKEEEVEWRTLSVNGMRGEGMRGEGRLFSDSMLVNIGRLFMKGVAACDVRN